MGRSAVSVCLSVYVCVCVCGGEIRKDSMGRLGEDTRGAGGRASERTGKGTNERMNERTREQPVGRADGRAETAESMKQDCDKHIQNGIN